jgi:p-aminobenzoyl-glutamate transporter AbgT
MSNSSHKPSDPKTMIGLNSWEKFIPWYLTIISCVLLFGIGWFILDNVLWLREHMFLGENESELSYRSHQYFLLISTIRRSAGLFSGIALMLLGVGIVFYVAKTQTKFDMSMHGVSLSIVTASPGIIAMSLGCFLIAHNTASKDIVPIFGVKDDPEISKQVEEAVDESKSNFDALNSE